jgi:hypothetical protein
MHFRAHLRTPADFEEAYAKTDDLTSRAMRNLLISNGILTRAGKLDRETAARLGWTVNDDEGTVQR